MIRRIAPAALLLASWISTSTAANAQSQAAGIAAQTHDGQVFLVWTELPQSNVRYRVYRDTAPIQSSADLATADRLGEVDDKTSENVRVTGLTGTPTFFRIVDMGAPLAASTGLFAHTIDSAGDAWYAVTAVVGGTENTSIVPGSNATVAPLAESVATPRPVLQSITGNVREYAHWVSDRDTPSALAMWNRPSRAFNLRVVYNAAAGAGPRPVLLKLHARGGSFRLAADGGIPEFVQLMPDDWIGEAPENTFWYGFNEAFPDTTQYAAHVNVDYTVRRVMAELDFVQSAFPSDPERVYAAGGSMGGIGSVFLACRHPERFAAVHATIPKFDFGCSANGCWVEPSNGDLLWGSVAANIVTTDGLGVYDRLDLAALVASDPAVDRPLITCWNGRNDTVVGWPEKPPTYAAFQALGLSSVFFWDDRNHNGSIPGVWQSVMSARRIETMQYRIHEAMPAFAHLSLDDDPGDGDPLSGDIVGAHNGCIGWDRGSIEDAEDRHVVRCFLRAGPGLDAAPASTATVDWIPRRMQSFSVAPYGRVRFTNRQDPDGTVIEQRLVTADANGVLRIRDAVVTTAGNVFRVEHVNPVFPPRIRRD